VLSSVLRSDGYGGDLLGIPSVGSMDTSLANGHKFHKMHMNGGEVFKWATRVISESIPQVVEQAGLSLGDVSLVIPHQANSRILAAAARTLKMDENCFMSNIDRYGNTSAASIPIALCEAVDQGRIKQDDYLIFVGFGGGLSWASMLVQWGAPRPEDRQSSFVNRRRRQISYIYAYWRTRLTRWNYRLNEALGRTRPKGGRIARLRRKIERHPLD
jgi:3-oxoacyl-[acyl-carrier-protein] synthase-3